MYLEKLRSSCSGGVVLPLPARLSTVYTYNASTPQKSLLSSSYIFGLFYLLLVVTLALPAALW